MFPLGTVLFPTIGLPLRVFEPRYRSLTKDCLDNDHRFGVVLIERGSEVGGNDERFDVGTVARIVQADIAADGQATLLTVGEERFRVIRWVDGAPYPRAEVTFIDEGPYVHSGPDHPEQASFEVWLDSVQKRLRRVLAVNAELTIASAPSTLEFSTNPAQRLWQFCAVVPGTPHDDLALLCAPDAPARLRLVEQLLDSAEANANRLLSGN